MVTLSAGSAAVLPEAGEAEVIRGFAADVVVAEVVVETVSIGKRSSALFPSARERFGARGLLNGRLRWRVVRLCRGGCARRREGGLGWGGGLWLTERGMFHRELRKARGSWRGKGRE
jgi:hypothetical protein